MDTQNIPPQDTQSIANLDFEYELASHGPYQPPRPLLQACERWRHVLKLLPSAANRVEVWGVTPTTLEFANKHGAKDSLPALDIVRKVNDKLYSHNLEQNLDIALAHSCIVGNEEELHQAVSDCPHDWVLKHPFGVSGRERMLGKAGLLSDSAGGWARRKMRQGWDLLFEPWVHKSRELSLHFDIERQGEIRYLGLCELSTDASGVFRGNRVAPDINVSETMREAATQVAQAVASEGYWGPLSLDALEGRLGAADISRPLVEINARFSFGRLTLAVGRHLPKGCTYSWCHPSASELREAVSHELFPDSPVKIKPGTYRLPCWVDPEGRSGTYLRVESTVFTSG